MIHRTVEAEHRMVPVTFRWHDVTPCVVDVHLTGFVGETVHHGTRLQPVGDGWQEVVLELPEDAMVSYGFIATAGRRQRTIAIQSLVDALEPDPANPDRIHGAFGSTGTTSVLELPAAPRHPDWVPLAQRGPLGEDWLDLPLERRARILPGDPRLPAMVMLDGEIWGSSELGFGHSWRQRGSHRAVPTLVLVDTADREVLAERALLARYIGDELAPALSSHQPLGAGLLVAGQSYGGLAAAGLFIDLPDLIAAAVVQSGSFWFDETGRHDDAAPGTLTRLLRDGGAALGNRRIVVQVGRSEGDMREQSRLFAEAAGAAGARVAHQIWPGGHDHAWYRHALFAALDHLEAD